MSDDITPVYPDEDFNRAQKQQPPQLAFDDFEHLDMIANLMDSQFVIPGTKITFGIDAILGLIPVLGDTISLAISSYILHHAHIHNVPRWVKARMVFNLGIDWAIGVVPFVGDLFDVGWKANLKNVALLKKHARRL
jgi:hypothetical protein